MRSIKRSTRCIFVTGIYFTAQVEVRENRETRLAKLYLFRDIFKTHVSFWRITSDIYLLETYSVSSPTPASFGYSKRERERKNEVDAVGNFVFSLSILARAESAYDASLDYAPCLRCSITSEHAISRLIKISMADNARRAGAAAALFINFPRDRFVTINSEVFLYVRVLF